jgi:hypothetical protein
MAHMSAPPAPERRSTRLMHLDALRGLFLFMMAVDHIPSDLQIVTNHPWGFMSAAEGFVFLAGLMGGMIYTRKLALIPGPSAAAGIRRRALTIYLWHFGTFMVMLLGVWLTLRLTGSAPGGAPPVMAQRPALAFLAGGTLLYQPGLLDVLPLYCVLILCLPWLLQLLEGGHRRALVLGSFAVWAATNAFWPQQPIVAAGGLLNTGAFNLGAWQLLYILGVVFGHASARGESLLPAPRPGLIALILLTAALLWANRRGYFLTGWPPELHHWLTNKNNLAPLRLLNVFLLFYLGYLVLWRFPRILHIRPLAFLGQHSIAVFCFHVLIAYKINALPHIFAATETGRFWATMLMLSALFLAAGVHAASSESSGRRSQPSTPRSPAVPVRDIGAA